jgi:protein-S-isoprenylcysteine O-methyltransferase Ste14
MRSISSSSIASSNLRDLDSRGTLIFLSGRALISKQIGQVTLSVAFGALLFLSAGTLRWPAAWVLQAELGGIGVALGWWLWRHDPALFRERLSVAFQPAQKRWDKAVVAAMFILWGSWLVLMGFDAVRFRWSYAPLWVQTVGALLIALQAYVTYSAFRENSFAAPFVKIQTERGHRVVSTGPYAYVRHPMYAGFLLMLIGVPMLLGSWYGLAAAFVIAAMLAVRAVLEERELASALPDYRGYTARVRYRLIPGIW